MDTFVPPGVLTSIAPIINDNEILLFDVNNISNSKYDYVLELVRNSAEFNENVYNGRLVFTLDHVTKTIEEFYKWIQTDVVCYISQNLLVKKTDVSYDSSSFNLILKSDITYTGTTQFDFGNETNSKIVTINNLYISDKVKYFTYIPIETTDTSLDDFVLNDVFFNIENIKNNISFDIRGISTKGASGIYTIKYILCIC